MTRYRWTKDGFVDAMGERMPIPERDGICLPYVVSDIEPIKSPIDGKMITSRSQLHYELEKHGKRVQDPSESPTKGAIKNTKFAAKRGLTVSEQYRDYDKSTHKAAAK